MPKKFCWAMRPSLLGAYYAACRVASAYPGTPNTEILEAIARDFSNIKAEWAPNEKVALEVATRASFAGARLSAQ